MKWKIVNMFALLAQLQVHRVSADVPDRLENQGLLGSLAHVAVMDSLGVLAALDVPASLAVLVLQESLARQGCLEAMACLGSLEALAPRAPLVNAGHLDNLVSLALMVAVVQLDFQECLDALEQPVCTSCGFCTGLF